MESNIVGESSEAVTSVEDSLALAGGFGTFQVIASLICQANYIRSAFFYYPLPLMPAIHGALP